MAPIAQVDQDFVFGGAEVDGAGLAPAGAPDPLGPLAQLPGTWKGDGFNTIWRPHHPSNPQDRFLELNLTTEDARLHQDQRPDPQPWPADARHQHVRHHLHAADLGDQQWRRPAHRTGDLGQRTAHHQPQRTHHRGPHGLDPARDGDPGAGDDPDPPGGRRHPRQQHHPVGVGGTPPPNSHFGSAEQSFTELNLSIATPFRLASRVSRRPWSPTPTAS